jgi:hypothetical protein
MASDAGRVLCRPPGFVLALTLSWLLAIPTAALGVLAAIRPAPP